MEYEAATENPDGSFILLTTSAVNAFGYANEWVNAGMRVTMVRDKDSFGGIVFTVTACKV